MVRLGLFLSSYAPLFLILAIRFRGQELKVACAAVALLGVTAGLWVISSERAKAPAAFQVIKVEDRGSEVAGYLASYLLPFVALAEPALPEVLAYAIFLAVAATVYVQSEMIQINPIFYVLGRRVVRVTTEGDWQAYLITKRRPLAHETVLATTLATGVLVRSSRD